ncbi:hypothetical protein DMENIID0001_060580 [Sergentomyia squamirostris]
MTSYKYNAQEWMQFLRAAGVPEWGAKSYVPILKRSDEITVKALQKQKLPKYYKKHVESVDNLAIRKHIEAVQKIYGTNARPDKYLMSTMKSNSGPKKEKPRKKQALIEEHIVMVKNNVETMTLELWLAFLRGAGIPKKRAMGYANLLDMRMMESVYYLHNFEDDRYWGDFLEEDQDLILMHGDRIMDLIDDEKRELGLPLDPFAKSTKREMSSGNDDLELPAKKAKTH